MKVSVSVTNYSWSVTTALQEGENSAELAERCETLAEFGVQHAVVIPRGAATDRRRPQLCCGRGRSAVRLAHTPG
jgi:hypothetical protein